jgi:hypothetical protein
MDVLGAFYVVSQKVANRIWKDKLGTAIGPPTKTPFEGMWARQIGINAWAFRENYPRMQGKMLQLI